MSRWRFGVPARALVLLAWLAVGPASVAPAPNGGGIQPIGISHLPGPTPPRRGGPGVTGGVGAARGGGIAVAGWTGSGSGAATANAGTASAPTTGMVPASAFTTGLLYPGGPAGDAKILVNNPNPYPVKV